MEEVESNWSQQCCVVEDENSYIASAKERMNDVIELFIARKAQSR